MEPNLGTSEVLIQRTMLTGEGEVRLGNLGGGKVQQSAGCASWEEKPGQAQDDPAKTARSEQKHEGEILTGLFHRHHLIMITRQIAPRLQRYPCCRPATGASWSSERLRLGWNHGDTPNLSEREQAR